MEFMDEKIIETRNREERQKQNINILDGIIMKGKFLKFHEVLFFNDELSALIPESFHEMPAKMAKIKYPSENRPQVIQSNEDGSVNFAFSRLNSLIPPDQMRTIGTAIKSMIARVQPAAVFYEEKEEPLENTQIEWFDFKGYAIDSQIYNLIFVTSMGNRLILGIFNCLFADCEEWKPIAHQMMLSLKKHNKEAV